MRRFDREGDAPRRALHHRPHLRARPAARRRSGRGASTTWWRSPEACAAHARRRARGRQPQAAHRRRASPRSAAASSRSSATWRRTASPPAARSRAGSSASGVHGRTADSAPRAPRSCAARSSATTASTTTRPRPRSPTREYDALFRELQAARGRAPGARHARLAHAARGFRAQRGLRRRSRTACRCSRSPTPSTTRTSPPSTGAAAKGSSAEAVEYACELKFDGLAVTLAYEDGLLRAGRHARRRRRGRGRDREPAHRALDPAAPRGEEAAEAARGARRGAHVPQATSRRSTSAPRRRARRRS